MALPTLPAGTRLAVYPTAADHMQFFKYEMIVPVLEVETIHPRVLDGTFAPIAEFNNIGEKGWSSLTIAEIIRLHVARTDYTYMNAKDTIEICHILDQYLDETRHLADDRTYRAFMVGFAEYRIETIIHARQTIMRNKDLMALYINPQSSIVSMFSRHVMGKDVDITSVFDLERPIPMDVRVQNQDTPQTSRMQDALAGKGTAGDIGVHFFKSGG